MRELLLLSGYDRWVLPTLLLIPLAGALMLVAQGLLARDDGSVEQAPAARWIALLTLLAEFVVSAGLWWTFDPASAAWQSRFDEPWIVPWHANVSLGIDGVSLVLILLTTVLMPLAILGSWSSVRAKVRWYYALMLVLTTGMLGVFMALDLLFFYVMWEVMLVPMYFIIGVWGGDRRIYASVKFFIYTMLGSLLMLVGILYLWNAGGQTSFDYDALLAVPLGGRAALWLFGAFFVAFAIKVPVFPFHTWLPDAHVEAPTAGSVVLAAIMLKMGTYGFMRFAMPLFAGAAMTPWVSNGVLALAVIGILYGALVAMVQPDFKKLVAYSSVSHLGFVMLGLFALTTIGAQGAVLVMINHGISTGALFFLVGMVYERRHSREIDAYGGIARVMPMFAAFLMIVSLSSIGLPGTNGFVGEFLVLVGSFETHPVLATVSATGVIFAAVYLLWALQRVIFNKLDKPENAHLSDLNWREVTVLGTLTAMIFWIGLYPAPILRRTEGAADRFVRTVEARAAMPETRAGAGRRR
jgi:NADH-quinone oxidoreductase subunit M